MSEVLVSELLVNAFSEDTLVDLEQDLTLPWLSNETFLELLESPLFDNRASYVSQKSLLLNELRNTHSISPKLLNCCYFVDLLYDQIEHQSDIHPKVFDSLLTIKPLLLKLLVKDPRFVQSSKHYFRQYMDSHLQSIAAWTPNLGDQGNEIFQLWKDSVALLCQYIQGSETELPESIKEESKQYYQAFESALRSEEELQADERQRRKKNRVKRKVDEFLDKQMKSKQLPPSIIHFLQHEWRACLIEFHKKEVLLDYDWDTIRQFTQAFIEHFTIDSDSNKLAFIAEIKPKLEKYLHLNQDEKQFIFRDIDKLNSRILNNEEMSSKLAVALLEENRLKQLNMSSSVLKVAEKLKAGQWIFSKEKQQNLKIAEVFDSPRSFLLVDFFGQSAGLKSHHALAYDIVAKQVKLLSTKNVFNKIFVSTLEKYLHIYQSKRKEDVIRKREAALEEEEIRQQALEKAKNEAEALRKQKENAEQQLLLETQELRKQQQALQVKVRDELIEKHEKERQRILLEKEQEKARVEEALLKEAERIRLEKELDKQVIEEKLSYEVEQLKKHTIETERAKQRELEHLQKEKETLEKEAERIRLEKELDKQAIKDKLANEVAELRKHQIAAEEAKQRELEDLLKEKETLERELREKSEENRRFKIIEQVKALTIGSWLSLPTESDAQSTCKIAIIYPSTGKHVFVDSNGIRIKELTADEIVELILADKANIVKQENSFDNSMQEVIKSLRK